MPNQPQAPDPRRWWILVVIGIAQLMIVLDATIVNIALPSAQADLGFADGDRQWVITAYALAFGSLLLLGGRLADLFGRRRTLILGLGGFAAASALGGLAGSFAVLIAARALQGLFAALLAPTALALLSTTFTDPRERGTAFAVYGGLAAGGGAVGLLLGGVLTELLSWRWTLWVNLAFALPAALGALALLREPDAARGRMRIDLPGVLTAVGGVFALVYGFSNAERSSWADPLTLALLGAGVALLAAFVAIERRVANPLLPLHVVLDRNRGGAYIAVGVAAAGMFGIFLFLTYYLQDTLGFSPIETGFAFLPMVIAIGVSANVATRRLLPRSGPRPLVPTGMALAAVAMVALAQVGVDSSYAAGVLPALLLFGLGVGLIMAPSMSTGTLGVDVAHAGVASATVNTSQQVGGALGTALLSTLATSAMSGFVAARQPNPQLLADAAVHGYTTAFWWSAAIFATGAIVTALLLRSGAERQLEGADEPVLAH